MQLMEQSIRILTHYGNRVDDDPRGQNRLHIRLQRGDDMCGRRRGQTTGECEMEMKVLENERITPSQHLLVLTQAQARPAAAGNVIVAQRGAQRVEASYRLGRKIA